MHFNASYTGNSVHVYRVNRLPRFVYSPDESDWTQRLPLNITELKIKYVSVENVTLGTGKHIYFFKIFF